MLGFCSTLTREPNFSTGSVLEVGPDRVPSSFAIPGLDWKTANIAAEAMEGGTVDYKMADPYVIPVDGDSFDVVFSAQVLEHVPRPWIWMPELARVCWPGGYVITINPTSWPYHEAPVDCWRAYPEGMRALCEDAGLEVVESVCESLEPRRSPRTYPGTGALTDTAERPPNWPPKAAIRPGSAACCTGPNRSRSTRSRSLESTRASLAFARRSVVVTPSSPQPAALYLDLMKRMLRRSGPESARSSSAQRIGSATSSTVQGS